jgi:DNA-binding transcriptional LysR family regulator
MDKLSGLQIFRRVAETRSFSAAAKVLGISPAMVSKSIRQLEEQVGVRLLARSTRAVSVTEAGARYLQTIAPLLDELIVAEQQLRQNVLQPRGELRLSAPVDLGESVLAPVIHAFRTAHPAVTVTIDLCNRQVDLQHEPIDVALRVGRIAPTRLIARTLAQIPLLVCAAPAYLRTAPPLVHPRDLAQHLCLVNPSVGDPRRWRFQARGKLFSVTANVVLQINNAPLLVQAAAAGLGIIYLPAYLARDAVAAGQLVPLLTDYLLPPLPLSLVYAERRFQLAKVRAFIEHLSAAFAGDDRFGGAAPRG